MSDSDSDDDILLYLLLNKDPKNFVHSRNRKEFYNSLVDEDRRIRRQYIPRPCLQDPLKSAFATLYKANNDQALITVTGFDHNSFRYLLERFPLFTTISRLLMKKK